MSKNFISNENKSIIWNIILEEGGFNDIPESRIDNVKKLIDDKFDEIYNKNINMTKLELNKLLLKVIYNDLKLYKINEDFTSVSREKNNIFDFNKKLNEHQNNMNDFLSIKHPEKPKFEDENESFVNNISYDSLIKNRDSELNDILNNSNLDKEKSKKKISFLDLSEELFNSNENSIKLDKSNSLLSLSLSNDNIDLLENTTISINKNINSNLNVELNNEIEYIKTLEKKVNNTIDNDSDNKFNLHNKLNLIIDNQNKLFNDYNNLKKDISNIKNSLELILEKLK